METWRLRTPNEWDSFGIWSDVLIWRNQIYNVVIEAFKAYSDVAPQLFQLGFRDKAWSINRFAPEGTLLSEDSLKPRCIRGNCGRRRHP